MNIFIKFLLLNLLLITSSFSQFQNDDEELNCEEFSELTFEVDQDEDLLTFYAYAPGIDNPIAMVRDHNGNGRFEDNEVFYFTKDHLGSIRELTDKDGNVVQRYRYSAYGETTIEKANPQAQHKIVENRYAFTGREIENEFGCLYDFRNRALNVCSKQFIEPDPIGFEGGDENLFRYVLSRPISASDPFGLDRRICSRKLDFDALPKVGVLRHDYVEFSDGAVKSWGKQGRINENKIKTNTRSCGKWKKTTPEQDQSAKNFADQLSDKKEYSLFNYNCQDFSQEVYNY